MQKPGHLLHDIVQGGLDLAHKKVAFLDINYTPRSMKKSCVLKKTLHWLHNARGGQQQAGNANLNQNPQKSHYYEDQSLYLLQEPVSP